MLHFGLSEAAPPPSVVRTRQTVSALQTESRCGPVTSRRDPARCSALGIVSFGILPSATACSQANPLRLDFADDDWRKTNPRFTGENFTRNLAIVDEVRAIGAEIGATPAQTALAWLLTRVDDSPIPGTRRVARVEENTAADGIELHADQLHRLDALAAGSRRPARRGQHGLHRPLIATPIQGIPMPQLADPFHPRHDLDTQEPVPSRPYEPAEQ